MPIEFDGPTRDAAIASIFLLLGNNAIAKVFTGARPATTSDANTGTLLATFTLTGTWFTTPVVGQQGTLATVFNTDALDPGGVPGYVRFYSSDNTCRFQGPVVVSPTPIPVDGGFQVSHSPWVAGEPVRLATTLFKAQLT